MFPERKCDATFLSRFSSRISAVVCFRYVSSHGNESCYAICEPHVIGRLGGLTWSSAIFPSILVTEMQYIDRRFYRS